METELKQFSQPTVSYEPLHHKYRPQTFADLVGQEAISTTLSNAIQLRRIAPAYLFTGPRGTGKTSSARILAKSLNCIRDPQPTPTPCGVCDVCQSITRGNALDVIEIDAASNTGVDNIRELIERAQFAPVQCRYKIYCLDEVHMLSTAAFNALLKTLEEPPERVVFILATTDPQRVLPTIISRCQRFDFRRIPLPAMIAHLSHIAQQESIAITPTALELVAQIAQGGLRDAESLLDQLSLLAGEITVERVWDLVGSVPEQDLLTLCEAIVAANPEVILDRTRHLLDRGREPLIVLQNLTGFYRDLLIAKTAPNRRDLVALTEETWHRLCHFAQAIDLNILLAGQQHLRSCEGQVKNTTQPRLWLEVTLLGLIPQAAPQTLPQAPPQLAPQPIANPQITPQVNPQAIPPLPTTLPPAVPEVAEMAPPSLTNKLPPPLPDIPPELTATPLRSLEPEVPPSLPAALPTIRPPELSVLTPQSQEDSFSPPPPLEVVAADANGANGSTQEPELDLGELWQTLLKHLSPPSRALLSQHGQLLHFAGREAQIGIRNGSLARIAQTRLPDVEAAFLKVFNRKVGVSLQVMTDPATTTAATASVQVMPIGNLSSLAPTPISPPAAPLNALASPELNPAVVSPIATIPTPPPQSADLPPNAVAPDSNLTATPAWETFDELTHATRNFAQFFNGAIVNLEGTDTLAEDSPVLDEKLEGTDWEETEPS
jgi:DNA polymerase III subunit gamma/tau